jgi:plasmid stabilization system protein ParE
MKPPRLALKRYRLVGADFRAAYDWHEDQRPGLGLEFAGDFRRSYEDLRDGPLLYAIRFDKVRRLNLDRFACGLFFVVESNEIRVLALLHASRDTEEILLKRRKTSPV